MDHHHHWIMDDERLDRRAYESALSEGECDVAYARIMLLGSAGVGKSSLQHGLMNLQFDPMIDSTIVADIRSVRPVEYKWTVSRSEEWSDVTPDDELNELAMLLARVHNQSGAHGLLSIEAHSVFSTASMFSCLEENIEASEEALVITSISDAIERARRITRWDALAFKPQPFFHVWDCGGQSVFLEVLPAFLTSRTMFLLLFDASKDFNSRWRSVQRCQGRETAGEEVNITTMELLQKWMSSIHAHFARVNEKGALPDYPRIVAIGSRGDKLTTEEKGKVKEGLRSKLENADFADIVKSVRIVDNTTAGKGKEEDETYKYLRKEIHEFASKKLIVKTPVTWVLYRKVLQVLVRESKKNIVTLEYARAVGVACKIQPEDVPEVLLFYHELGVVLFYPHIQGLRDKVILNPKWFVDCLGKVLMLPESDDCENLRMWKLLRDKGILVQPLYVAVWETCEGIKPEEMMDLLVKFHLAAEVKTKEYHDSSVKQFFLPAVLPAFTADYTSVPPGYLLRATSLHITFATGYVTPGYFARLVAIMAESPSCQLFFHKSTPVFHNKITFRFGDPPVDHVILTEMSPAVQIDVLRYVATGTIPMQDVCHNLKGFLETSCQKVEECLQSIDAPSHFGIDSRSTRVSNVRREFKFLCCNPECESSSKPHYLVTSPNGQQTCDLPLLCEESPPTSYRNPTKEEAYWFPKEIEQPHITKSGKSHPQRALTPPDDVINPSSNPFKILKSHFTRVLEVVSDPKMLANDLSSVDLITHFVKDKILSTNLSRYEGASILMNEFQRSLNVCNKPETLVSFCHLLKKQSSASSIVARSMLSELGLLQEAPEQS